MLEFCQYRLKLAQRLCQKCVTIAALIHIDQEGLVHKAGRYIIKLCHPYQLDLNEIGLLNYSLVDVNWASVGQVMPLAITSCVFEDIANLQFICVIINLTRLVDIMHPSIAYHNITVYDIVHRESASMIYDTQSPTDSLTLWHVSMAFCVLILSISTIIDPACFTCKLTPWCL
jgi:hypothetical protein